MAVITLSRQSGSEGNEIARLLSVRLEYKLLDKYLIDDMARTKGWDPAAFEGLEEEQFPVRSFMEKALQNFQSPIMFGQGYGPRGADPALTNEMALRKIILSAYELGNIIIVGRGAQIVLAGKPGTLHVRIIAPESRRIKVWQSRQNISVEEARKLVRERDKAHVDFIQNVFMADLNDPNWYDLILNTDRLSPCSVADIIVEALEHV
ncbi:MAG: cytidylate kinase-like family protein [Anaerolineaceae bacterium]|jgi:hypothetical protein|nr:cytidylate kinase-like family protein [Anaerolineaceae bacterium]HNX45128.1 cytidylate kinase-like family protein [Anaerolineaceae bacterium]HPT23877.1 cytidylate kinase-like family protein [Anaerolineaceae bacterium]